MKIAHLLKHTPSPRTVKEALDYTSKILAAVHDALPPDSPYSAPNKKTLTQTIRVIKHIQASYDHNENIL